MLVKRVFDAIPSELAKEDKRFILADLEKGASRRKYEDPTQWLIDAAIKDHVDKIHRSIVLSRYNVSKKDDVLYLPLYMTIFI